MRIVLILFFPLLGLFDYFRVQQVHVLGYMIFVLPLVFSSAYILVFKPLLTGNYNKILAPFARFHSLNKLQITIFLLFISIVVMGIFRAILLDIRPVKIAIAEISIIIAILFFIYSVVVNAFNKLYIKRLVYYIGISLFLLMIMNLVAAYFGVVNPGIEANYHRIFHNPFGIVPYRVNFPFMTSGQMLAIEAGFLVLIGLYAGRADSYIIYKIVRLAMVLTGIAIMIGHGGRASLMLLVIVIFMTTFWKYTRPFMKILLFGAIMFPVLLVFSNLGVLFSELLSVLGINITRSAGDVSSFSNRDQIYAVILYGYLFNTDILSQLFGYGAYGQITSGFSYDYSYLFQKSYADPLLMPAHNTLLQILIDYGLIGATIFVFLILNLTSVIKRNASGILSGREGVEYNRLMNILLFYLVATSMTEASVTYYSFGVLSLFVMLNMFVVFKSDEVLVLQLLEKKNILNCDRNNDEALV